MMQTTFKASLALAASALLSANAFAGCQDISFNQLQNAANVTLASGQTAGLRLNMWATFVDETGKVCAVVNTGTKGESAGNSQWLGSRVISAQKANTSNAFSLDEIAISTGALYAAVQPGGSLYGLQESNPVDAKTAYSGSPRFYGRPNDPLVGERVGGVNVFGGGIPLYKNGRKIGAIGVSGDTSCTDHAFAWKMRELLGFTTSANRVVEKLNISTTFTSLGDHPNCLLAEPLDNNASLGFQ